MCDPSSPTWRAGFPIHGIGRRQCFRKADRLTKISPETAKEKITADSSIEEIREALSSTAGDVFLSVDELVIASEIAYLNRDLTTAILAMRRLVERDPLQAPFHHRLAVLLHAADDADGAQRHAELAIGCDRSFAPGYELLAHIRSASDDVAGTIEAIRRQIRHCGASHAVQMHFARLLLSTGQTKEALQALHVVNDVGPPTEESLLLEAELLYRSADPHAAASAAARAVRLWPEAVAPRDKLARILVELGNHDEAIPLLLRMREDSPEDASISYLLSASFAAVGRNRPALEAILDAIAIAPLDPEYLYLAGILSDRLGERDEAIQFLRKAMSVSPDRVAIHAELTRLLAQSGDNDAALEVIERATDLFPIDPRLRDLRLFLLARVSGHDAAGLPRGSGLLPSMPMPRAPSRRRPERPPSRLAFFGDQLITQGRVLAALVLRDFHHRTVHSRFGILSLFIPQAIQIVTLGIVLSLFNGGQPPLGDHLFFFYATGVMPFYLFIHVIDHSQNLFQDNIGVLQVPVIARLDLVLAMALTELLVGVATIVVTFGAFEFFSYGPQSDNHIEAVYATLAVWLFALGLGLISAVMSNIYRPWSNGWMILQRFLYVVSGVFFLPQSMPEWIREPLAWNPLLQCIEWFRTGFFRNYEPPWLDKTYVLAVAFGTTITGLILERALLRLMAGSEMPDAGRIIREGRVSFPVGFTGTFHPLASARDNISFLARVYGMDRREVSAWIEDFCELGRYFDMPVGTYSSGMFARIAVATSFAFDFDLYLVDEVIEVGDAGFRRKCAAAFQERLKSASLVLVSQHVDTIRQYCDLGAVLHQGKLSAFTTVDEALERYEHSLETMR